MSGRITSIDGLFGQKIHYDEDGNYVGESWPGLFEGSWEHYSQDKGYVGSSDPGLFAGQIHRDSSGQYMGESMPGLIGGHQIHYGQDGHIGDSWDTLTGTDTFFDGDDLF